MLVGFQVSAAFISYIVTWLNLAEGLDATEKLLRQLPNTTFNLTVQYASPAGDLGPPQMKQVKIGVYAQDAQLVGTSEKPGSQPPVWFGRGQTLRELLESYK